MVCGGPVPGCAAPCTGCPVKPSLVVASACSHPQAGRVQGRLHLVLGMLGCWGFEAAAWLPVQLQWGV